MKDNPLWIDVTQLMRRGVGDFILQLTQVPELQPSLQTYISRLNAIDQIKEVDLHIEEVTGEDKTIDVVVEIFNKVNSGGTKLSKGDLALAKICAEWPEARHEMTRRLSKWSSAGFDFRLEWLLRCMNTIVTGEAMFSALADVPASSVREGLDKAERAVDTLLNLISSRLGLDHDRVLGSPYSFPVLTRYLVERGGHLTDYRERDKLLYWYVHTFLWGRYAGSTETVLNQDLGLIDPPEGALDRLIDRLRQNRGDLRIHPDDFRGWSVGARFYPLLYMLTRVYHARDWCSGIELSNALLGKRSSLELHHIFPKALLYKAGYDRPDVNALANFTFLTQECNLQITDRDPSEYLEDVARLQPGVLESHWIPMDRQLWRIEHYPAFLAARRELLANAANEFLDSLLTGGIPEATVTVPVLERAATSIPGMVASEDEERLILECAQWVAGQGLPQGELMYELTDARTGEPLAVLDLAWPNGLQEGLSQPVALLLDEASETEEVVNRAGYRFFVSVDEFKAYVRREILALEPVATG